MIASRTMISSMLLRAAFPHLPPRTLAILAGVTGTWGNSALVPLPPLIVIVP